MADTLDLGFVLGLARRAVRVRRCCNSSTFSTLRRDSVPHRSVCPLRTEKVTQKSQAPVEKSRTRPALSMLQESPEHDQRELDLLSSLLQVLQFTKGWNDRESAPLRARRVRWQRLRNRLPLVVQQGFHRPPVPTENLQIIESLRFRSVARNVAGILTPIGHSRAEQEGRGPEREVVDCRAVATCGKCYALCQRDRSIRRRVPVVARAHRI
jgi:hypothetical protein